MRPTFFIFLKTLTWKFIMEFVNVENINLVEVLPRIIDLNVLPFGVVKMDLTGKILEYNMAEAELTGTNQAWALGKNFFNEVATCTNTPAFYGKFVEGVKKGFLNTVFHYNFTHCETPIRVRVHMMTMPDAVGRKIVVMLVTRVNQPVQITEAFSATSGGSGTVAGPAAASAETAPNPGDAAAGRIANAVMSAVNRQGDAPSANDILEF